MKSPHKKHIAAALTAVTLITLTTLSCKKETPVKNTPTQTAQNFMIDVRGTTQVMISGDEVWHFDELAAAKSEFGYDYCPEETEGPDNGNECRDRAIDAARAAKCAYWNSAGRPFWVLTETTVQGDTSVPIELNLTIASESFMKGGQFNTNGKYSFSLRNSDNSSRVTSLGYSIDGGSQVAMTHTIVDGNSATNGCFLNLYYSSTCGPYGNPDVYSFLKSGYIKNILWSDDASSNDDGCSIASVGITSPLVLRLQPGHHTLTIYATVNGNAGSTSLTMSKTVNINVSAEMCNL